MTNYTCRKCSISMEEENIVEVFAYDKYNLCAKCEDLFFKTIERFFTEE